MRNVNFKPNLEQLAYIVCSGEVKGMVSNWCESAYIDKTKVFSYYDFLEYAKNNDLEHKRRI